MSIEKGILLAGGTGSRLYPLTIATNKQLMPIYDKPVLYYPLTTLMLAGIRNILVISTPQDLPALQKLLRDGHQWGMQFSYLVQIEPKGLPEAFILGEKFINNESVAMILGDNFFHGHGLSESVNQAAQELAGAHIFTYTVKDPSRYGVALLNKDQEITKIEEKPQHSQSNLAVTGLYYFDETVAERAQNLKPSKRNELEIVDLIQSYLDEKKLNFTQLGRGYVWFDVGTADSLLETSHYVEVIQSRQGIAIASPEEIAWRMGFINDHEFEKLIYTLPMSKYRSYLTGLVHS